MGKARFNQSVGMRGNVYQERKREREKERERERERERKRASMTTSSTPFFFNRLENTFMRVFYKPDFVSAGMYVRTPLLRPIEVSPCPSNQKLEGGSQKLTLEERESVYW